MSTSTSERHGTTTGNHSFGHCLALQPTPRCDLLLPCEPCALDIDFQTLRVIGSPDEYVQLPRRVTIVNTSGDNVLDVYARYETVEGYERLEKQFVRSPPDFEAALRVSPANTNHQGNVDKDLLLCHCAKTGGEVESWVHQIVANRTVVMHGAMHDVTSFKSVADMWRTSRITDTQALYAYLQPDGLPSLAIVMPTVFGSSIQPGDQHFTIENAWATMLLHQNLHGFDRVKAIAAAASVDREQGSAASTRADETGRPIEESAESVDVVEDDCHALGGVSRKRKR